MTHRLDLTDDELLMLKAMCAGGYFTVTLTPALVLFGSPDTLAGLMAKIRALRPNLAKVVPLCGTMDLNDTRDHVEVPE